MPLREKDHEHNHNEKVQTLTPQLQAFYNELAVKFPKIRVTDGKREASQKVGKNYGTSKHNTGEAFDISAQDKDVADYLMNDVEGAALLNKYGLGLLDETNPETIKKTGATGPHYHIGKDPALVQKSMVRYETLSKQQPKQKPQPITLQTQIQGQPITTTVDPVQFEKEVQKEEKKKEKAEEKAEKSEARKRLEEKKEKQKAFLDALQVPNSIVSYKQAKQEQYDIEEPFQLDLPETPNQLPSLPSMFQMPDVTKQNPNQEQQFMEDGGKVVSKLWEEKTGTSWEEAKKQGLTDGSFEKNMELRNRLVNNQVDFEAPVQNKQPNQDTAKQYDTMVAQMVAKGSTLDDLVKQRVGTKEGLRSRFPDLFSSSSKNTKEIKKKTTTSEYTFDNLISDVKKVNWKGMAEEVVKPYSGIASTLKNVVGQISDTYKVPTEKKEQPKKSKLVVKKKTTTSDDFSKTLMENLTRGANTPLKNSEEKAEPIKNSQASKLKDNPKAVGNKTYKPESKIQWRDFDETDLGNAINQTTDIVDTKVQQASRYLNKIGVSDTKDATIGVKNSSLKIKLKPKPQEFFEEIGTVRDVSGRESDSLLSYRNQWDNNKGFDYYATPVKKDRKGDDKYENTVGVGHFLLDASVAKGKNYSHEYNKKFVEEAKKNDEWIPVFKEKGDLVNLKYKKPSELKKEDKVVTPLRQMKFSEINFDKTQQPKGFTKNVKEVTKNNGKGTYLLFKDRDGYSRFSGGSVVFIFKDKYNNTIVRDFAGSLNQIQNEGEQIKKQYSISPEDLTIGYHDVGSFSAKPKADKNGTLSAKQWEGFNTEGGTGGALLIPKPKKQ